MEGRFVPQKFAKYAGGADSMDFWQVWNMLKGQRMVADPIGWFGAFLECGLSVLALNWN